MYQVLEFLKKICLYIYVQFGLFGFMAYQPL